MTGGYRRGLGVISRRIGDHAATERFARQREHQIGGSPYLESSASLQVFALEKHAGRGFCVEAGGGHDRRFTSQWKNSLGGGTHVVGLNGEGHAYESIPMTLSQGMIAWKLLDKLLTEQPNPASDAIDMMATEEALRVINAEDQKVAVAVEREIPAIARAVDAVVAALSNGGRLFYLGAGTSGRLGVLDASEIPPTFSAPPEMVQGIMAGGEVALSRATEASEDDPDLGVRDLTSRGFTANDVLVGIAASGRTPYVLGAVAEAKRLGAVTIGICCVPAAELSRAVDFPIAPLVGPEIVAGSTRMKSGTAQKLVLNMLSTATFIRLGYVYGNLMVNVQPRNEKLVDRARRIIVKAAGVTPERATDLIKESGMRVRTAIVMGKAGVTRDEAERRLAASGGRVRQALGE